MVDSKNTNTEQRILEAAQLEFSEKGLNGARMQGIADRAGINKALLHYYYRSKDKLFSVVFKVVFKALIPRIGKIINQDLDLFEKIRLFTCEYINLIQSMPHIPIFVLHELSTNPKRLSEMLSEAHFDTSGIQQQIKREIELGKIREITFESLIINTVSLCVFPIVAKPIARTILFDRDTKAYDQFLEKRKSDVADFIINSIQL